MCIREDLYKTVVLLNNAFESSSFTFDRLNWLYIMNPNGNVIQTNYDLKGIRIGHYAVIPQLYTSQKERLLVSLSLNTAVLKSYRKKGLFTELARETYDIAKNKYAVSGVIGVANSNSTPGFVNKLDFCLLGSLPVKLCIPKFSFINKVSTYKVTSDFLNSEIFRNIVDSIDPTPLSGWSQIWTDEILKWRLSNPINDYYFHINDEVVAISCVDIKKRIKFGVLIKLFIKKNQIKKVYAGDIITSICRTYNTFFVIYAGYNSRIKVSGLEIPKRLLPSPLNLIFLSLNRDIQSEVFEIETFEFLDCDDY